MSDSDPDREPIDILAEEFAERCRRGENPSISEYVEKHADLADEIQNLFPSVAMIEGVKQGDQSGGKHLPPFPPQEAKQLGDYRIVREIGRGGMGIVYEAEQQSLGRRVAMKVLPAGVLSTPEQIRRFQREAQAAARLHHTNIVPVFGVGEQDGVHYYVMQFIDGRGLDDILAESSGAQPKDAAQASALATASGTPSYWHVAADVGRQAADALQYAHARGTLHRDVKPANLLLDAAGAVWVTDFGLAKLAEEEDLTQPGDIVGTLRYMAPEQFKGEADARSDVYALGLTLYEMLTLRPAYEETDRSRLIQRVMREAPLSPRKLNKAIPADLETVVLKAIAREPSRRYQTAGELAEDLSRFIDGRPIIARKTSSAERAWLWCRRNPAVSALGAAAVASLVVGAVAGWVGYVKARQALAGESRQLKETQAQRQRAETNLGLAIDAFDKVFEHFAPGRLDSSLTPDAEEGPTFQPVVSTRDAAVLENLLGFYSRFAEENRGSPALQAEIAKAHRRMAQIHNQLGQFEDAHVSCRAALNAYERLAGTVGSPGPDPLAKADLHIEQGFALQMTGQHKEARDAYKEALQILEGQANAAPDRLDLKLAIAKTHQRLGSIPSGGRGGRGGKGGRRSLGDPEASTRTALSILRKLVVVQPQNPRYRHALALAHRNLAVLYAQRGRIDDAETEIRQAVEILEQLAKASPSVPAYSYDLVITCTLGPSYVRTPHRRRRGPHEQWVRRHRTALATAKQLAASHPNVPTYLAALGRAHLVLGETLLEQRRRTEAEAELNGSVKILGSLIDQELWASTYLHDYMKAAQALARLLQKKGQARRAGELLSKRIHAIEGALMSGPRRRREWGALAKQHGELATVLARLGKAAEADRARGKAELIRAQQDSRNDR